MLRRMWQRVRALFFRRRLEREMFEEMRTHISQAEERYREQGLSDAAARRAAVREFGPMDLIHEEARDARGGRWAEALKSDVRYAVRQASRRPIVSATIVCILALGLGVGSALFTIIYSVETNPPAGIARDDRLVRIRGLIEDVPAMQLFGRSLTYSEVQSYLEGREFAGTGAVWSSDGVELDLREADEPPVPARAIFVSDDYFDILGVRPIVGSPIRAVESGAVIGHRLWQERLGGADVIGQALRVNGAIVTIVGVAPPEFRGATVERDGALVWLPLESRALLNGRNPAAFMSGDSAIFSAVARLRPGVDVQAASAVVESMAARFAPAPPEGTDVHASADVVPLLFANDLPSNGAQRTTYAALAGLTLLILVVIGTNVSSLMLGAGVARRREMVVRLSLGSGRGRVVRQLLTESVVLALTGGVLGLILLGTLLTALQSRMPGLELALHWPTVAFTACIAVGAGVLCGLSPALHATRLSLSSVLKDTEGGIPASRLGAQRRLVILQVALTQPLLIALAATIVMLRADTPTDRMAERADRVVVASFDPRGAGISRAEMHDEITAMAERVETIHGVAAAVPHEGGHLRSNLDVHPADRMAGAPGRFTGIGHSAAPGYFDLLGIPLVRGREFRPEDENVNAVIIGSDLARELWGDVDPIGRRLRRWRGGDTVNVTVVGVVDAAHAGPSEQGVGKRVFVPLHAPGTGAIRMMPQQRSPYELLILTDGTAAGVLRSLRDAVGPAADRITLRSAATLAALDAESDARAARIRLYAAAAGMLALMIACVGLYAVVALAVRERLREIGIRVALGARSGQVVGRFMRIGLKLSLAGIALGMPVSVIALNRLGIDFSTSTLLLGAVTSLVVITVTLFATWLPARRAATVDPLATLQII